MKPQPIETLSVISLAYAFSAEMRSALGMVKLRRAIKLNRARRDKLTYQADDPYDSCDDMCDANMVMHAALMRWGIDAAEEGNISNQDLVNLWNTAWKVAKLCDYFEHYPLQLGKVRRLKP
jgi:hypothetical protein